MTCVAALFAACGSAQVVIDNKEKLSAGTKTLLLPIVPDKSGLAATTGWVSAHQHADWLDDPEKIRDYDAKAKEVFLSSPGNKPDGALQMLNLMRTDLVTVEAKDAMQFTSGTLAGLNANATSAGLTKLNFKTENVARVLSELKIDSITLILLSAQDTMASGKRIGAEIICFDAKGIIIRYKDVKNLTLLSSWTGKFGDILTEYQEKLK